MNIKALLNVFCIFQLELDTLIQSMVSWGLSSFLCFFTFFFFYSWASVASAGNQPVLRNRLESVHYLLLTTLVYYYYATWRVRWGEMLCSIHDWSRATLHRCLRSYCFEWILIGFWEEWLRSKFSVKIQRYNFA